MRFFFFRLWERKVSRYNAPVDQGVQVYQYFLPMLFANESFDFFSLSNGSKLYPKLSLPEHSNPGTRDTFIFRFILVSRTPLNPVPDCYSLGDYHHTGARISDKLFMFIAAKTKYPAKHSGVSPLCIDSRYFDSVDSLLKGRYSRFCQLVKIVLFQNPQQLVPVTSLSFLK